MEAFESFVAVALEAEGFVVSPAVKFPVQLKTRKAAYQGAPWLDGDVIDSQVEGRVVIEAGARLERATVRGPAVIAAGAQITDAFIGPYTAIGKQVTIDRAELEHSIVLEGSTVRDLEYRVEASLIGRNVKIGRGPTVPKAYRFVVGDNSEIAIL